jgi:DNA-binding response OmpR family regulator
MAGMQDSILILMKSELFAQSLKKALEASGYRSTVVTSETAALKAAQASVPSLIIVDRKLSALVNLRQLRTLSAVPIVAVEDGAAPCEDEECVPDYDHDVDLVVCNQSPRELVARVRAILRRLTTRSDSTTRYHLGPIRMDLDRHEVTVDGRLIDLTPKEFQILHQFLEAPGRVFSRQEMLNRVWGEGYALEEHALDVHIHSLRKKIEVDPSVPRMIVTIRGVGYKLRA